MKKKVLLFVITFLMMFGIASVHTPTANAASWGAKKIFTTPKATRGVWYIKNGKIYKFKITAHTDNGTKLYQELKGKEELKWLKKLSVADEKSNYTLGDKVSNSMNQANILKFHGITGFGDSGWLSGPGMAYTYVPVKRIVKGKRVSALRCGAGLGNLLIGYAYHSKKLAK